MVVSLWMISRSAAADDPPEILPDDTVEYASVVSSGSGVSLPADTDERGIGSRFGDPGDKWTGGKMACAPHDAVNSVDHVCAHRWYPCGTILIVEYPATGKRNWCVVADRGPYGANVFAADGKAVLSPSGGAAWYVMIHAGDPPPDDLCPEGGCTGKWRGVIDMSPVVSKGMGHPGMGYVKVWRLKRIVDYQKYLARKRSKPLS
jgi:hypothetical protein